LLGRRHPGTAVERESEETPARSSPPPREPSPTPPKARILIVDDNKFLASAWARLLVAAGYEVVLAGNPPDARALFARWEEQPFDIVIIDQRFEKYPEDMGEDLARAARALFPNPMIFFVAAWPDGKLFNRIEPYCDKIRDKLHVSEKMDFLDAVGQLVQKKAWRDRSFEEFFEEVRSELGLTTVQGRFVRLIFGGNTYHEIADAMGCSVGRLGSIWREIEVKTSLPRNEIRRIFWDRLTGRARRIGRV
jgi:CheY-like chemotaxis protein